jgi:hypothetical protein
MILASICRENTGIFALCLEIPQLMIERTSIGVVNRRVC